MSSKKKVKKKRVRGVISSIIVGIIVAIAVGLLIMKFTGGGVYTIISGSMEPKYHVGSMIYVKPAAKDEIKVGDAVTFAVSDKLTVTHRIAEIQQDADGTKYITKGDANDTRDASPVIYENIIGKPVFSIPLVGYIINYIKTPQGIIIAVAVALFLLLWGIIPGFKKNKT